MHLIMDARCNNISLMLDHASLTRWMRRLCKVIDMTPLGDPVIRDFPWPGGDNPAPSACLFLAESSITIHLYPEFDYLYLDVFSCKSFVADKAIAFIEETLGITERTTYLFKRGVDMESRKPLRLTPILGGDYAIQ